MQVMVSILRHKKHLLWVVVKWNLFIFWVCRWVWCCAEVTRYSVIKKLATADAGDEYKFLFTPCTLWVHRVLIHSGIESAYKHLLAKKAQAKFPVNRVQLAVHVSTPGSLSKKIHLIVGGQETKKIVLMLIDHVAMEGN